MKHFTAADSLIGRQIEVERNYVNMKKLRSLTIILILIVLTSCGGQTVNKEELAKIPNDFPISEAPILDMEEFVLYTDKTAADQYSAELIYNSNSDYDTIINYYKKLYPGATCTDFGIAYHILKIPQNKGEYLVSVQIYSSINRGEKGVCTVTISALEQ